MEDAASIHALNTQQTVNAWTHSTVDLQHRSTGHEERLCLLEARVAAIVDTVSNIDPAAPSGAGSYRQRLVDAKNLAPEVFSGAKGMQWRDWNHRMKCYMAAMKTTVRHAMDSVERRTEPVLYEHLDSFGITLEDDVELKAFMALKTSDQAHIIARQHDLDPRSRTVPSIGRVLRTGHGGQGPGESEDDPAAAGGQ